MTDTTLERSTLAPAETVTRFLEAAQNGDTEFAEKVLDENLVYQNVGLPTIY
ncbi:limonene-1,2-epoxide hydrolase, partial [Staphylococcus capitis]|nr:limonene-1,2-epoxide hydrolase [Staphylococcus capitis]